MRLEHLPTPAAVVDEERVERNTRVMGERMARLGARLRPHVKTHKSLEAARLSVRGQFGGLTVSTIAEARFSAEGGFTDITYAVPLAPQRVAEVDDLSRGLERLNVLIDAEETVDAIERLQRRRGRKTDALLKVDCGYHRAGVDPLGERGVALARRLRDSPFVRFRGVLAHGGHAYAASDVEGIRAVAAEERDVTVAFADRLRGLGIAVPEVSIGSTPTMAVADDLAGVTEVRPGNYVFFDDFQLAVGACAAEDRAFSVLTTVLAVHPSRATAVVDAGALALSKDLGATHVPGWRGGYGSLEDLDTRAPLPDLDLYSLSQEHGLVRARPGAENALSALRVGQILRVHPNHSCLTAALHDRYHVVREGRVSATWRPCRGW